MYIPMIVAAGFLLAGLIALLYAALSFVMAEAATLPGLRRIARMARAVGIVFVVAALVIGGVDLLS